MEKKKKKIITIIYYGFPFYHFMFFFMFVWEGIIWKKGGVREGDLIGMYVCMYVCICNNACIKTHISKVIKIMGNT